MSRTSADASTTEHTANTEPRTASLRMRMAGRFNHEAARGMMATTSSRTPIAKAMTSIWSLARVLITGIGLLPAAAGAHHSIVAEYDTNDRITIRGEIRSVRWANPHAWLTIEARDAAGRAGRTLSADLATRFIRRDQQETGR